MFGMNKINTITTEELEKKIKNNINAKVVDVREPSEYANGHIKGSLNIPLSTVKTYNNEESFYVICQSGMRSRRAAKIWSKKGMNVTNVLGGMSAWKGKVVK